MLKVQEISPQRLRQFAQTGCLYALVDACDAPMVPPKMMELGAEKAQSMFQGGAREDYWAVAPYLAQVDDALLRWLFDNLWKEPWGIFAMAQVGMQELHSHLRKLLIVEVENGRNSLFRYYDPRVLRKYLDTCDAAELKAFYGPVKAFAAVQQNGFAECSIIALSMD